MKYTIVAAALTGAVMAADGWETWTSTTKKVVDPTTTWSDWVDPAKKTTTWSDWVDPSKKTTTWSDWVDPSKVTKTWSNWESVAVTSSTKCAYVTEVPVKKCDDKDKNKCWDEKTKTTIYADKCTWADWEDPAHKPSTTWGTWEAIVTPSPTGKCSYVTEVPKKCAPGDDKKCWDEKVKTTIYAETCYWDNWEQAVTKTVPAKCSYVTVVPVKKCDDKDKSKCWDEKTTTTVVAESCSWDEWAVVTKTVSAQWSGKDGWFGPAWETVKVDQCVTNTVTSYGYPVWSPVPEVTKVVTATWSAVPVAPKPAAPMPEAPKPAAPAPPSKCDGKGCAPIKPNDKQWSMTYSPYTAEGKCKTQDVITVDIKKIADLGFTSVRVYSTDCSTLEFVGAACAQYNIKIILGVFIDKTGIEGAKTQVAAIKKWAKWELVELIVIGNESVFQGFCKAEELVAFIKYCKTEFSSAGYTGYCTTTEPLAQWQQYGTVFCEVVDVVTANLYAYFNDQCEAANAGVFIKEQITILEAICTGKETYVMESGWPKEGQCNGKACAGVDEQKVAIKSIQDNCGEKIVFFSFEDELWKEPGQFGVEQHWGCANVFDKTNSWSALPTNTWANVPVKATTTTAKKADPTGWETY